MIKTLVCTKRVDKCQGHKIQEKTKPFILQCLNVAKSSYLTANAHRVGVITCKEILSYLVFFQWVTCSALYTIRCWTQICSAIA